MFLKVLVLGTYLWGSLLIASEACLIGSPLITTYVDEFNKVNLTESDSFLKKYREYLFIKKIQSALKVAVKWSPIKSPLTEINNSRTVLHNTKNYIPQKDIECALKRVPTISANRKICESTDSDLLEPTNSEFYTQETPCVTEGIANYLKWGLNEALSCFSPELTTAETEIIFKKINLESSFGFFFQGINGTGITQVVPKDIREVLQAGFNGHRFLKKYLQTNKQRCHSFTHLFKQNFLINSNNQIPQCQFISLGDGVGRAYLAGIGLYVYYRSYHPNSAESMLRYLGIPKSNEAFYFQMRTILTLGMYNKGPGTVWDSVKFHFEQGELAQKYMRRPSYAFNTFKDKLQTTSFYLYVTELERSHTNTFRNNGQCKFGNSNTVATTAP